MNAPTEQPHLLRCDGQVILGILHLPDAVTVRTNVGIVIVVGGPQYRVGSHRQFVHTARALAKAGHAVLRFDTRGMGDSGAPARNFGEMTDDIRCAVDELLASVPGLKQVALWGLCDGASAAAMYCQSDPRITHLVLVNPWVRGAIPEGRVVMRHYYLRRLCERSFWTKLLSLRLNPVAAAGEFAGRAVQAAGAAVTNVPFVEKMLEGLVGFPGRVLLLISEQDLTAKEFLDLCGVDSRWRRAVSRPDVTRVDLAGADHTFSTRTHLDAANSHCIGWLRDERRSGA
jgi:exosortase A-associated hydrolase 1